MKKWTAGWNTRQRKCFKTEIVAVKVARRVRVSETVLRRGRVAKPRPFRVSLKWNTASLWGKVIRDVRKHWRGLLAKHAFPRRASFVTNDSGVRIPRRFLPENGYPERRYPESGYPRVSMSSRKWQGYRLECRVKCHSFLTSTKDVNPPVSGSAIPVLGEKIKRGYVFWLFFELDLCSATSMESSHRDLLNDAAEHRSILKTDQNTHNSLIFQDRPMFNHINGKLSPRPFKWYGWTQVYLEK